MSKILMLFTISILSIQIQAANTSVVTQKEWKEALLWAGDSSSRYGYMEGLAQKYAEKKGIHISIADEGSIDGITLVKQRKIDIGGIGRYALDTEIDTSTLKILPVAWDALVVVVHKDNPIDNISLDQLRALYDGEIDRWSELGVAGDDQIELHTRIDALSGVGYTMRKVLFADFNRKFQVGERFRVKNSTDLEISIERNNLGIGITGFSSARHADLKILKIDGIFPSEENIRSGQFFFYRTLYLTYNPTSSRKSEIESFIAYLHSPDGQKEIRASGTTPYLDAVPLVLKQMDQNRRAQEKGLYRDSQ